MSISFSVRPTEGRDEAYVARWLNRQTRLHIRFNIAELGDWFAAHHGFVAMYGSELVGLVLYAMTSSTQASVIGLAVGDRWRTYEPEVLTALFEETVPLLHRRGTSTVACVAVSEWVRAALRRYARFEVVGALANYLKSDWLIPEQGNLTVQVAAATPDDARGLLNVDQLAFPPLWHWDEYAIFSPLRRNGHVLKAEWRGVIVGYVSGVWNQDHGHLNRLAVHPQVQGYGIGKRLLAESLLRFHRAGVYQITLNTQADNLVSRRLYEQFGFHLVDCDTQVLVRRI